MRITPASSFSTARYRCEYSFGSCSNIASFPTGTRHISSSNTKCLLPIIALLSPIVVAIPCATIYSTLECISACSRLRLDASSTTAFAMEWGKCSSMHAAIRNISSEDNSLKDTVSTTEGFAFVRVPVLSNTMVSASAIASKYFPPFTVIL